MSVEISRHKTAIGRSALSLPAKLLFQSGLVNDSTYFLDYGCGRGDDVKFLSELNKPITLEVIKKNKQLSHLSLIKQSRLSVMPIDTKSWKIINKISNINK